MPLSWRISMHAMVIVAAVMCVPAVMYSQAWVLTAGPSVPQGPMSERRAIGGQMAMGFGPEHRRRGFQYRVELAYGLFPVRSAYSARLPGPGDGTLQVGSGMAYLLYSAAPGPLSLHAGLGAGAYEMHIPGRRNPYGFVPGLGVLFGAKVGTGRVRGLVELQQQAILSDYGNGDFESSTFVPLRFGLVVH